MDPREACVHRLLDRYLVEVVETYNFCPWARTARTKGELTRAIVWGARPPLEAWLAAARSLLARPETRVAMVIAPEYAGTLAELRELRGEAAKILVEAGIAEFHPRAELDLASPARLVRFLRRSPDPMLQLVPIAILDSVRTGDRRVIDRAELAAVLNGSLVLEVEQDIGDKIADANFATVGAAPAAIEAALDAIAADRAASYPRAGIGASASSLPANVAT